MSTRAFIISLFCRIDDRLQNQVRHPQAKLWPSEIVTLGVLRVLKGIPFRAFHRWACRNLTDLFPNLPERTRLLRLLRTYCELADTFLAKPKKRGAVGYLDSFGIEMIHPRREGRSEQQFGRKGKSNHRWIVGIKFCPLLDAKGQILDGQFAPANVHDTAFVPLVEQYPTVQTLADGGFHRADKKGGDPGNLIGNLILCGRGEENGRMIIETCFSLWAGTLHLKKTTSRAEAHIAALLTFAVAAYNRIINWTRKTKLETTFFSL